MKPASVPIDIQRGDSFEAFGRIRDTTWDGTAYVPGEYKDITGWVGKSQMRDSTDSQQVVVEFEVTLGNQETAPGSFWVRATPEQTAEIVKSGVWDVQFTTPAGEVFTIAGGAANLGKDVTRV